MTYRTCIGCVLQGKACTTRDVVRQQLAGLAVTSIRWKCKTRVARFVVGDPVTVDTVIGGEHDDDGSPLRDLFPGVVIRDHGSKMLVYIAPGTLGTESLPFAPTGAGHGFCKIPLSRLEPREGERQDICKACELPASHGHQKGYFCSGVEGDFDLDESSLADLQPARAS